MNEEIMYLIKGAVQNIIIGSLYTHTVKILIKVMSIIIIQFSVLICMVMNNSFSI